MALFFFHLVSPNGYEVDEIGSEFPSMEMAYLEGHAAAAEMCTDIMRERQDPTRYQFEIFDDRGRFLIELLFSDIIRPNPVSAGRARIRPQLRAEIRRAGRLHDELRDELQRTRAALAECRATLARSSVIDVGRRVEAVPRIAKPL
jgi:hypothetical protein